MRQVFDDMCLNWTFCDFGDSMHILRFTLKIFFSADQQHRNCDLAKDGRRIKLNQFAQGFGCNFLACESEGFLCGGFQPVNQFLLARDRHAHYSSRKPADQTSKAGRSFEFSLELRSLFEHDRFHVIQEWAEQNESRYGRALQAYLRRDDRAFAVPKQEYPIGIT